MGEAPRPAEESLAERYELQELLGEGGMGQVFRAFDRSLERPVAVKLLHGRQWSDAQVQRFFREARLLASLRHPAILPLHGFGVDTSGPFLVTALVEGAQELGSYVRGRSLEERLACFGSLLSALAYAHEQGVVHRDVKPANVLVDVRGNVFLCDFGLAWAPGVEDLTATNTLLGTPLYAAPEQLLGGETRSAQGDVYSLGVVLYELVAERHPFAAAQTIPELCALQASGSLSDLSGLVPPPVEAACLRALSADRRRRFADARAFLDALQLDSPRRPGGWALGLLLAAACLVGALWLGGSFDSDPPASPSSWPSVASSEPAEVSASPGAVPRLLALGQRSRATYSSASSVRLGGRKVEGIQWRMELSQRVITSTPSEVVVSARVERLKVRMCFFSLVLLYDGWDREGSRAGATFFRELEGASLTLVLSPKEGRLLSVTGLEDVVTQRLIPRAKEWRASPAALAMSDSLSVLSDRALGQGLLSFSNEGTAAQLQPMVQAWLLPPGETRPGTTKPPLFWNPLSIRMRSVALSDERARLVASPVAPPARIWRYALRGVSRAAPGRVEVSLRESYLLREEPEWLGTLLTEHYGVRDWNGDTRPEFERVMRVEIVPAPEEPR